VAENVTELLNALRAAIDGGAETSELADAIEALAEQDPESCRAAAYACPDDGMRLWALGLVADERDFDVLAAGLADPALRYTALEALANQSDTDRMDAVARPLLADPDPAVRSKAAGIVAFAAKPGALTELLPLAADPVPHVRMVTAWHLGGLGPTAEPTLRMLLDDPDPEVRTFAERGLARVATVKHDQ
jgi:HEAT repeat protein